MTLAVQASNDGNVLSSVPVVLRENFTVVRVPIKAPR